MNPTNPLTRRRWLGTTIGHAITAVGATAMATAAGCVPGVVGGAAAGRVNLVWGRRGESDGRFLKPRAIAIDPGDNLYIVDTTGRIQKFDVDGNHQLTWTMPETTNGRPTGLAFDTSAGRERLLVADTHYYRMMAFTPDGQPLLDQQIGGTSGSLPGQFAFVTDAVTDSDGCIYVGEYGDSDRIQKFDPDGRFVTQWGGTGREPERFLRPQSLVVDGSTLWVADACNHRIQQYDISRDQPAAMTMFGVEGSQPGQFYYPYDLTVAPDGTLFVCEYGNQRIQHVSATGAPIATWSDSPVWGSPGHDVGQLYQPWGVVMDSRRRLHVLDSNNHRVQRLPPLAKMTRSDASPV